MLPQLHCGSEGTSGSLFSQPLERLIGFRVAVTFGLQEAAFGGAVVLLAGGCNPQPEPGHVILGLRTDHCGQRGKAFAGLSCTDEVDAFLEGFLQLCLRGLRRGLFGGHDLFFHGCLGHRCMIRFVRSRPIPP